MNYYVMTNPFGDAPDQPIVLIQQDGAGVRVWDKNSSKWVDSPIYIDSLFGDDPGWVNITEEQAAQYRADGVGMDEEGFARLMAANAAVEAAGLERKEARAQSGQDLGRPGSPG